VRLGFAIVAALKPDLLITDEVLAVGDEAFQKKCVRWMEEYLSGGGTLILVSHSMYHVQKLCRQAVWLKQGEVAASGDVYAVTQAYLAYQESKSAPAERSQAAAGDLEFRLLDVCVNGSADDVPVQIEMSGNLRVRVRVHSRDGRAPVIVVGIVRMDGTPVYGVSSEMDATTPRRVSDNVYAAEIDFAGLPLLPGSYAIKVHPLDPEGMRLFDTIERGLTVRGQSREFGIVRLAHAWRADAPAGMDRGSTP
jgi:lipopolysaccharide transport system ATP-binding protein